MRNALRTVTVASVAVVLGAGMTGVASAELIPVEDSLIRGLPGDPGGVSGGESPNNSTPGAPVSKPDGPTYFGTMDAEATPGDVREDGTTVYPAQPEAQDFSSADAGGWSAYQEYSPLCFARGVTCVNWNFEHMPTDGPKGEGDAFIRTNGTSLGVAPCTAQNGVARWVSPLFTYNTANADSWTIDMDVRQTTLLVGDGHSTFNVQILDEAGRVVTTAYGPEGTVPLNEWKHKSASFDGSKLIYGKNYRLSVMVDVVHAETALNWGNVDLDNIKLTATKGDGEHPKDALTSCEVNSTPSEGVAALLSGNAADLCPATNKLGQSAKPLTDVAQKVLSGPLGPVLDKASGGFAVVDLETGQFLGYMLGKEAIPSSDPRDLITYIENGTEGKAANYAIMFVGKTAMMPGELLSNPGGVISGQLQNATYLLSNPGRILSIPFDWSVKNLEYNVTTVLTPLASDKPVQTTQLGGMVWHDANENGVRDQGEAPVPGVDVALTDVNGNDHGTKTTDDAGRYVFENLRPTTDPQSYHLVFDTASLPEGASFTTKHVADSTHENTSNPSPKTGRTDRITLSRGEADLNWNAGVVGITGDPGDADAAADGSDADADGSDADADGSDADADGSDADADGSDADADGSDADADGSDADADGSDADADGSDAQGDADADGPGAGDEDLVLTAKVESLNGEPFDWTKPAVLPAGQEATIEFTLTNTGDTTITEVTATTTGGGTVNCSAAQLASGESATCTLVFTPKTGEQKFEIAFSGKHGDKGECISTYTLSYAGGQAEGEGTSGLGGLLDPGSLLGGVTAETNPLPGAENSGSGSPLDGLSGLFGGGLFN
ncbi:hypothetical protein GCM10028864_21690 [Microlunatus parietis]